MRLSQFLDNPRGVVGNYLYTTNDKQGTIPTVANLTAYALTDARRPSEAGRLPNAGGTAFADRRAYFASPDEALIVELDGAKMRLGTGRIPIPGHCSGFAASGNNFWTARSQAAVFDASNIDAPRLLARLPLPATANSIAAQGDVGYVADGEGGLVIVSLEDRLPPTPTPTFPTPAATSTPTPTERVRQEPAIYLPRLFGSHSGG